MEIMNKYYISKWIPLGKCVLIALFLSASVSLYSQTNVAINKVGNPPVASAVLDLSDASNAHLGFLMTNVSLASVTDASTIPTPTVGMIVWNTNSGLPNGVGFYYWSGSTWLYVGNSGTYSLLSGTGTANYLARWTSTTALGTGVAQDNGTGVSLSSSALTPVNKLDVNGNASFGTYAGTAAPANGVIISGQVGMGTSTPNASAVLDITSSSAGMLPPRMTAGQMNAIASPSVGLVVLNTTTSCLEYYTGSTWQSLSCPCTSAPYLGTMTGNSLGCASSTGNVYSVNAVTNATYAWTVPAGSTITSGQGTNSITVTFGSTSGNISVISSNSCGTSNAAIAVTLSSGLPATPATPSGNVSPLISTSFTYTIAVIAGATNYTWSVSSTNATITSGQGTTSVTIAFNATPTTMNICVFASNGCGNSSPSCLSVTSSSCVPAVVLDQSTSLATASGATQTLTLGTTIPGEIILISANGYTGGATWTGSATVDGNAATTIVYYLPSGNEVVNVLYYVAPTAGSHTIIITEGNNTGYQLNFAVSLMELCGTAMTSANIGTFADASAGTTINGTASASVTTTGANSYIYSSMAANGVGTSTGTLTWTTVSQIGATLHEGNGIDGAQAGATVTSATSYTITNTDNLGYSGIVVIPIKP
jgi:large repetitive protein